MTGHHASPAGPGEVDAQAAHPLSVQVGVLLTVAFVVLDQATKELAERWLEVGEFVPWLGSGVGWELVYNPGGAFGVPLPSWVFLAVSAVVLVLVARVLPRTSSLLAAAAYGLLLSGAIGNVLDRLLRSGGPDAGVGDGWVVDFVAWGSFPRFNVADSAITVGFALLVLALLLEERRGKIAGDDVGLTARSGGAGHDTARCEGADGTAPDRSTDPAVASAEEPDAPDGLDAGESGQRR